MKTLVVFTSRTGYCRHLAMEIAEVLDADAEEVVDLKSRHGILGYISSRLDAWNGRPAEIVAPAPHKHPRHYGMVVIGTPVWAGRITPAIRTYLRRYAKHMVRVAFFVTLGASGPKAAFGQLAELAGRKPIATLSVRKLEMKSNAYLPKTTAFVDKVKKCVGK